MSVDFEELANAGLPPEDKNGGRNSFGKGIILLLVVSVLLGAGYWAYRNLLVGEEPEITPAAELLIVRDGEAAEPGVLPHMIDTATEFPDSLDTLREGIRKPAIRETEEGQKSVGLVTGEESPETPASFTEAPEALSPSVKAPAEEIKPVEKMIADRANSADEPVAAKDFQSLPEARPEPDAEQANDLSGAADHLDSSEVETAAPVAQPTEAKEEVILEAEIEVDSVGTRATPPVETRPSVAQQPSRLDDLTFDVPDMKRDWGGLILVPDNIQLSRAFSTTVSLARVEAHPLEDGRLRVWMRIANETNDTLSIRVNCTFSGSQNQMGSASQNKLTLPEGTSIDTTFVSPFSNVKAYTILIKRLF